MELAYVRDPGILAIVRRVYFDGSALVCWFLDGIRTIEVLDPEEYIIVTHKMFRGEDDV